MTMKLKNVDKQGLKDLAVLATQQLEAATAAWQIGLKVLPTNSKEWRAICKSGKAAQLTFFTLKYLARDLGWTANEIQESFPIDTIRGFG